jgi:cobalt/nickel transport system permease protein
MLSRGFDGVLPSLNNQSVTARQWITALSIPFLALISSLIALMIGW